MLILFIRRYEWTRFFIFVLSLTRLALCLTSSLSSIISLEGTYDSARNPPLKRVASMVESTLSVLTFADAIALFLTGLDRDTLCLEDKSLYDQYHVEEDSIAICVDGGRLLENLSISSRLFFILPCSMILPSLSMMANSEQFLCRSNPTNSIHLLSPSFLIRFL